MEWYLESLFVEAFLGVANPCALLGVGVRCRQDYDIVLPLIAAAGVSSVVVEVFSRKENKAIVKEVTAAMPRDMSLEIGVKVSGESDMLVGKVQVRCRVLCCTVMAVSGVRCPSMFPCDVLSRCDGSLERFRDRLWGSHRR